MPAEVEGRHSAGLGRPLVVDVPTLDGPTTSPAGGSYTYYYDAEGGSHSPIVQEEHPVMAHTQLIACLLSGNNSEHEAFLRWVRKSSWRYGNQVLQGNISRILSDGHNFVLEGTLIPLLSLCQS